MQAHHETEQEGHSDAGFLREAGCPIGDEASSIGYPSPESGKAKMMYKGEDSQKSKERHQELGTTQESRHCLTMNRMQGKQKPGDEGCPTGGKKPK
jgi:hypothetical protein